MKKEYSVRRNNGGSLVSEVDENGYTKLFTLEEARERVQEIFNETTPEIIAAFNVMHPYAKQVVVKYCKIYKGKELIEKISRG